MSEKEDTLLEFPCRFPIKAIGKNSPDFETLLVNIIKQHLNKNDPILAKTRLSKGDKFAAVTITFEASSKKQLDAMYQDLTDCPQVSMVL